MKLALIIFFSIIMFENAFAKKKERYRVKLKDAELQERLKDVFEDMEGMEYHRSVKAFIKYYLERRRESLQNVLGRSFVYFPIFDHYLDLHDMPQELKYLPVIESALNPKVVSKSGARGLWQFMPRTGRGYGLLQNSYVDERCDPYRSTESAMIYLKKQYKRFGDWKLALAAYNCGPNALAKVIKKAGTKNYWKLRKHLPKETRGYVPAFIAACYVMNYYQFYDLNPNYVDYDMQLTETIKVYQTITFKQISKETGVDIEVLEQMNPSYIANVIPREVEGNYLVLPAHSLGHLDENYYYSKLIGINFIRDELEENIPSDSLRTTYQVQAGDRIELLADKFSISQQSIQVWNGLKSPKLHFGQKLTLYVPSTIQ